MSKKDDSLVSKEREICFTCGKYDYHEGCKNIQSSYYQTLTGVLDTCDKHINTKTQYSLVLHKGE